MSLLLWATDVHLDHLPVIEAAFEFGRALSNEQPTAIGLIVTGDIAEAYSVQRILQDLARGFGRPVYFVLGNHDYYRGSFQQVDKVVAGTCRATEGLHWLHHEVISLTDGVSLVGVNGWYDAGYGDPHSDLQMSDFTLIEELFAAQDDSRRALLRACAARARKDALTLEHHLAELIQRGRPRHILVATHVPPFREAAWHEGKPSDDRWAPFFSSRALGAVLLHFADQNPSVDTTVLCGHTHGSGCYQARENLTVYTGRAHYGAPELAGFVDFGSDELHVRLY